MVQQRLLSAGPHRSLVTSFAGRERLWSSSRKRSSFVAELEARSRTRGFACCRSWMPGGGRDGHLESRTPTTSMSTVNTSQSQNDSFSECELWSARVIKSDTERRTSRVRISGRLVLYCGGDLEFLEAG